MTTINQLLNKKGHEYFSIGADETVHAAIELMARLGVGSLLVTDEGKFSGIITERDYTREVELKGRTAKTTLVRDIMRTNISYLVSTDSVQACMDLMMGRRLRYMPVIHEERILGVVSIGDLIKCCTEDQKFTIEQLEHFINGELLHH